MILFNHYISVNDNINSNLSHVPTSDTHSGVTEPHQEETSENKVSEPQSATTNNNDSGSGIKQSM